MKALSIRQPWANFVACGIKKVENRNTLKNFRGSFLIHASKSFDHAGLEWIHENMGYKALNQDSFKCGGIIAEAEIYDCVQESDDPWFFGPNGFLIRNAVWLPEFIPCPGALGFWEYNKTKKRG